jgi:carboxylesterase type B
VSALAALQESLIDLDDQNPPFNLPDILHQRVQAKLESIYQRYWISSSSGNCRAINPAGIVLPVGCDEKLPVLCTQSAPFSNSTFADNSEKWHTKIQSGNQTITGYRDRAGFRFLGIRYAEKPERFTYSEVFNKPGKQSAIYYGSECIQEYNSGGTEDCLFLNIFTTYLPQTNIEPASSELRPVMFYIHGGSFLLGAGSFPQYDGGNLASRGDVVVVTINYRLGAFGFLALNDGSTNGNFGLADQITALDWVRANIASFGGDPTQITIFGQSAGAISVRALLGSPKAIGKYTAAMAMSNLGGISPVANWLDFPTITGVSAFMHPLLTATGCLNTISQVECLRAANSSEIAIYGSSAMYVYDSFRMKLVVLTVY